MMLLQIQRRQFMDQDRKVTAMFLISVLCYQCATPQDAVQISTRPNVIISCSYMENQQRNSLTSQVQCLIENLSERTANIAFKNASLEHPSGDMMPIEVGTVKQGEVLDTIVGIIAVIIIVGLIVAIVVASKGQPIDFPRFSSDSSPEQPKKPDFSRSVVTDTLEIRGYHTANLFFTAKHGAQRTKMFVLRIGDDQQRIEVPIKNSEQTN